MPRSLVERLAELPDPRSCHGHPYPLVGLLTLCLVAMLAGHTTPTAIAQFGRLRQKRLGHARGFKNGNMPCRNSLIGLLQELAPDHLDRIIGAWLADRHPDRWEHIALDGKRLCASRDADVPGTHLLTAYAPHASAVLAQMTVEATNEYKTALRLLDVRHRWAGSLLRATPCSPTPITANPWLLKCEPVSAHRVRCVPVGIAGGPALDSLVVEKRPHPRPSVGSRLTAVARCD